MLSKISCVNEHDPLLPDSKDTPPMLEESPLLMKSSHDSVSDNMWSSELLYYSISSSSSSSSIYIYIYI